MAITVAEYRTIVEEGFDAIRKYERRIASATDTVRKLRSRTLVTYLRLAHCGYTLNAGKTADVFREIAPNYGIAESTAGVYAANARKIVTHLKAGRVEFREVLDRLVAAQVNGKNLVSLVEARNDDADYTTTDEDGKVHYWHIVGSLDGIYKKLNAAAKEAAQPNDSDLPAADAGAESDGERGKEPLIDVMLANIAHLTRDELIQLAGAIDVRLGKLNAAETVQVAAAA